MTANAARSLRESNGIWLVAEREIGAKLRSKAFLISTGILLIIALAGILIGGFTSQNPETTAVAATSDTAAAVEALPNVEVTEVANAPTAIGAHNPVATPIGFASPINPVARPSVVHGSPLNHERSTHR